MLSQVDVIVPCYRYGRFLETCVRSVLEQEGVGVRVLIIDDCSPDETAEVGSKLQSLDPRVFFTRHPINRGHIATYNEGIEWIASPYYLLLSADDYLLPGALARTVSFMEQNSSIVLAFGQAMTLTDDEQPDAEAIRAAATRWTISPGLTFIRQSGATNCVPTPAAVVRTVTQKQVGGYRPELPHTGDMELWLRLAARGAVASTDGFHAVYRRHSANMSLGYMTSHWLPDLEQREVALRWFFDHTDLGADAEELRNSAFRKLAAAALKRAGSAFNHGDLETSRRLRNFADRLSSSSRFSLDGLKLTVKETLGVSTLHGVRNSLGRMRRGLAEK